MAKITFERNELFNKLKKAATFVPKKAVITAHETFLFDVKDKSASITSTDGNKQITIVCEVTKHDKPARFTVPAKLVLHVLESFTEQDVTITVKDNKVEVKSGKSKYNMPSDNGESYPLIQNIEAKFEASFNGSNFNKAIETTKAFCDPDNASPALQGVCLRIDAENNINVFGCNGQHAAKVRVKPRSINKWDDILVPVQALAAISKCIPDEDIVDVIHDKERIEIRSETVFIKALCFNVKYPKVEDFFVTRPDDNIELNSVEFTKALQRLDVFSPKDVPLISVDIKTATMTIATIDNLFNHDGEEVIDVMAKKEVKIGFNINLMNNIMKSFTDDTFKMYYEDFNKVVKIEPVSIVNDNNVFFIVMPYKL